MKRILIFLISALIIFGSVTVAFGYDKNTLEFLVAADTHFVPSEALGNVSDVKNNDSQLFNHATTQGQQTYESEAILASFLNEFSAGTADTLFIAGDLTNGKRISHIKLADYLKNAEKNGKQVFVINGNHDIESASSEDKIDFREFKEIYADFGYSEALTLDTNSCSYTAKLNDEYRLLAIDSCEYSKDEGKIDANRLQWINQQLKTAKADGVKLIALMHHSALKHYNLQKLSSVEGSSADEFAKLLADEGVELVFTGHMHGNDISSLKTKNGNTVYDVMTGSLITYPNSFRSVTVSEKTEINTHYIKSIDTSLLPNGYNEAQLELIENDYPSFSKGYLTFGMKFWMDRNLGSAYKIRRKLNLNENSQAYKIINSFMAKLGDSLNKPIYGQNNSIQSVAKKYDGDVKISDYNYVYELVGAVVADWYSGDETDKSAETELLMNCVKYILVDFLNSISSNSLDTVYDILKSLGVNPKSDNLSQASDLIIKAVLKPLLNGIVDDYSPPADVNIVIQKAQHRSCDLSDIIDIVMSLFKKLSAAFKIEFYGV